MSSTPITRRALLQQTGTALSGIAVLGGLGRVGLARGLATPTADPSQAVLRVRIGRVSDDQRSVIARLDETHRAFEDGSREFLLWPGDAEQLRDAGVGFDVLDEDVRRSRPDSSLPLQPGERAAYRGLDDYWADLAHLAETYPAIARLHLMPTRSLLGREVLALEISNDVGSGTRDGRPVVHMDGLHHCREWPAGEMPIMWAFDLCEGYGTDATATRLVDEARTFILPVVNPDGFVRTQRSLLQVDESNDVGYLTSLGLSIAGRESYWRKNLRGYTDANVTADADAAYVEKVDAHGIDLNRGYPFFWGDDEGSSDVPEDQTYRGTAPYSEPETHNVRDLVLGHLPIAKITHHTSGELMLYAWGRNPFEVRSPDADLMQTIGDAMAVSNGYAPKQAYGLYPTSGTSRDWGHGSVRTLAYTFEHGEEFHGPYAATIPPMYVKNRGAFVTLYDAVLDPANHLVVRGTAPTGSGHLRVVKEFATPLADGVTTVDERAERTVDIGADGSFEIHLPPSTRPHLYEAEFGGSTDDSTRPEDPAYVESWTLVFDDGTTAQVAGERGVLVDLEQL